MVKGKQKLVLSICLFLYYIWYFNIFVYLFYFTLFIYIFKNYLFYYFSHCYHPLCLLSRKPNILLN